MHHHHHHHHHTAFAPHLHHASQPFNGGIGSAGVIGGGVGGSGSGPQHNTTVAYCNTANTVTSDEIQQRFRYDNEFLSANFCRNSGGFMKSSSF